MFLTLCSFVNTNSEMTYILIVWIRFRPIKDKTIAIIINKGFCYANVYSVDLHKHIIIIFLHKVDGYICNKV